MENITTNFLHDIIDKDLEKKPNLAIQTRFPPEPNGYLHIGHAKAILINYLIAKKYNGTFNLRMDDTNPTKEDIEYVKSIKKDVEWIIGESLDDHLYYASDYFDKCYEYALKLIRDGHAFVCDLSADQLRNYRGTLTEVGKDSPYKNRTVDENMKLFVGMMNGEFLDGSKTLRAKINMESPNIVLRDPVLYRIMRATHHNTGDKWCIYPMYDYAHPIQDALEGVSHSLCSLEFKNNRPLYEWVLNKLGYGEFPKQREFARLNISYTLTSKRKLLKLVEKKIVDGWDDPRMTTLSGMRRRGYTASSILSFIEEIGVAKSHSVVDIAQFEHSIRNELNFEANRIMTVLDPLKVVITNYPDDKEEFFDVLLNPNHPDRGTRILPFSKEIYIERSDFMIEPARKYFRLFPGNEVRLIKAYFIKCHDYKVDSNGKVTEVHCTYDDASKGGQSPDGRKVKGTIHWVSIKHAHTCQVNLYDRLFTKENPSAIDEGETILDNVNSDSLIILSNAKVEPYLKEALPNDRFQFMRNGYFICDQESKPGKPVFNRIVALRDSWAKKSKG
ncbi:MAG: glutamine--tRNA ligase/YqeY domain fusion protein [Clostridiales bacterium]|nr:glutamine--tRNA ligase/YqeY domain fusion protein [Clostridiales bacterium]